jgi:hypothetical protein
MTEMARPMLGHFHLESDMQFTKPFQGVPDGEIYPVQYQPGDECPPELESAATELGAFGDPEEEGGAGAAAPKRGRTAK